MASPRAKLLRQDGADGHTLIVVVAKGTQIPLPREHLHGARRLVVYTYDAATTSMDDAIRAIDDKAHPVTECLDIMIKDE